MAEAPKYPIELTATYWDKKKGGIAKIAGKTGIGDLAKKAEAAFKKIKWTDFDKSNAVPTASNHETLKVVKDAQKEQLELHKTLVTPAIKAIQDLAFKAADTTKKFKSNKAIPNDSVKIAEGINKKGLELSKEMQFDSAYLKPFADRLTQAVTDITKVIAGHKAIAAETAKYLEEMLKGAAAIKSLKTPDTAAWDKEVKQAGRSVCNNLKLNPALAKKHLKSWTTKFGGFDLGQLKIAEIKDDAARYKAIHDMCDLAIAEGKILKPDLA